MRSRSLISCIIKMLVIINAIFNVSFQALASTPIQDEAPSPAFLEKEKRTCLPASTLGRFMKEPLAKLLERSTSANDGQICFTDEELKVILNDLQSETKPKTRSYFTFSNMYSFLTGFKNVAILLTIAAIAIINFFLPFIPSLGTILNALKKLFASGVNPPSSTPKPTPFNYDSCCCTAPAPTAPPMMAPPVASANSQTSNSGLYNTLVGAGANGVDQRTIATFAAKVGQQTAFNLAVIGATNLGMAGISQMIPGSLPLAYAALGLATSGILSMTSALMSLGYNRLYAVGSVKL